MPLTLVTGPANAEKAGHVLAAYRAALDRAPLLVVPTAADVERYRRELAVDGAVFGVEVMRFAWLEREIARRSGISGRPLGALARERVAAAAVAATRLDRLAASAATPGFLPAFLALVDELEEQRITPGRWYGALRAWAAQAPAQGAYAEELGALYGAYRDALERLGRPDARLHALAALDALRVEPSRWGGTPVFLYGFDDLTGLQRDAVETLAVHCRADVMLSLTYEPGRAAFAGRGATFQELLALGAEHVALDARAEHYASLGLHDLERGLFETGASAFDPGGGAVLLEGGGERAELELVAAHAARVIREEGIPPEEIAVVLREPEDHAPLLADVFAAAGVPIALARRVAAGHTALGRGVVGLLRCALLGGTADDLLAWLRTPGKLERPALADRLEADARRAGARTAAEARALWEDAHPDFALDELDRLVAAHGRGPAALCERLAAESAALFAAPWRGRAPVLTGADALDARVAGALRGALGELGALAERAPGLAPSPADLERALAAVEVFAGDGARAGAPGAVEVTSPDRIRARRVRALYLCALQEGVFPRAGRPEPFLGDSERAALNAASGLRLALREDQLAVERFYFYAAASRPTDVLALSWHAADDEGEPRVRSLFVDDVLDLLDPAPDIVRRPLGAAGFDADLAPTGRELLRAELAAEGMARRRAPAPIAPLRDAAVLAALRERETWSASALEAWTGCPVKWFVDRLLSPEDLAPDPEPMLRGELAHRVLEEAMRDLVAEGGGLTPERLDEAKRHLHAALERHAAEARISVNPERLRAAVRRLEADLLRYVEHAAHAGSDLRPAHFELRFGGAEDDLPAAPLAGGELRLAGRIDRIDTAPRSGATEAIIYDYKGRSAPPSQARWLAEAKLQIGLYMLAVPHLLGLEAVGGLYQPLGAEDARPRGLLRGDADTGLGAVRTDRLDEAEFEERLQEVLDAALAAVRGIRSGALEPRPDTCAWNGGCAHPSICRCET
ncbi:MAG: ATP-dependent helicase/nuclease subunit [Solirubrobacteraceae bacterium]|nr:ATP-dependent helicase/nuclease subunit [Solirubrobacteraceae bacterium]